MKKLIVALLMIPTIAHAEFWSGNKLLQNMQGDSMDKVQAYGYVMGVFDTAAGVDHCGQGTPGLTVGQINDIAKQYILNNPSTRNISADVLVRIAFGQVWPCKRQQGRQS